MKNGVGLIQAIMIILIVSGMMIIVLKYAAVSSKHVADTYVKEQTTLFLDSAIEQTLLDISLYDRSAGCLPSSSPEPKTKRNITYTANVNITKYYLQNGSQDLTYCGALGVSIADTSSNSHGMVLLEVEANATKNFGTPNAVVVSRILRRTLQQP